MIDFTTADAVLLIIGLAVVVIALIITASLQPPSMVIMGVSIITLALLAAWIADPNRADNLVPLIGVGIGALSGAVTNIFREKSDKGDTDE